jgi:hypothetical protein
LHHWHTIVHLIDFDDWIGTNGPTIQVTMLHLLDIFVLVFEPVELCDNILDFVVLVGFMFWQLFVAIFPCADS